jgi:hypothetical protein
LSSTIAQPLCANVNSKRGLRAASVNQTRSPRASTVARFASTPALRNARTAMSAVSTVPSENRISGRTAAEYCSPSSDSCFSGSKRHGVAPLPAPSVTYGVSKICARTSALT